MKKSNVTLWAAIITFAALTLFGQTYDFSTSPYDHFQTIGDCKAYSGSFCVQPQQWGFIAINPIGHVFQMKSGIGKQGAPYEPPVTYIIPTGDCNKSCSKLSASAGAPKWVLTTGTQQNCAATSCAIPFVGTACASPRPSYAVQVWKYESGNWNWKGQVGADLFLYQTQNPTRVVGDFGYILETHSGIPTPPPVWSKFDLNTLSIIQTGIPEASVPPGEAQDGINGVHYTLSKTGAMAYRLASTGPPPSPSPTPTPAPNQFAAYITWAANNGITAGCGGGNFCPDNSVTRAQMVTFLWNFYHVFVDPSKPLAPCQQQFADVRCAP